MPKPSSECEAEVDLVLIQTSFVFSCNSYLKNTSKHKNNMIFCKIEATVVFKQGQLQPCFYLEL